MVIEEDSAYAGLVHQSHVSDDTLDIANWHLVPRAPGIRIHPRPEVSWSGNRSPVLHVLKRFLNLRVRMRPVGKVTVLDRREGDDEVVVQFLALGQAW